MEKWNVSRIIQLFNHKKYSEAERKGQENKTQFRLLHSNMAR